jgi:hypothetical protein
MIFLEVILAFTEEKLKPIRRRLWTGAFARFFDKRRRA